MKKNQISFICLLAILVFSPLALHGNNFKSIFLFTCVYLILQTRNQPWQHIEMRRSKKHSHRIDFQITSNFRYRNYSINYK